MGQAMSLCIDPDKMLGAADQPTEPRDVGHTVDDGWTQGIAAERARCRAIVLRYFGNEWRGNDALAEIDGLTVCGKSR